MNNGGTGMKSGDLEKSDNAAGDADNNDVKNSQPASRSSSRRSRGDRILKPESNPVR